MTQNLQFHNFRWFRNVSERNDFINFIRSSQWTPSTLREAIENNFPQINNFMDFGLASAIDELAFSHLPDFQYGRYWVVSFNNPIVGRTIENLSHIEGQEPLFVRCEWVGAFTLSGTPVGTR